MDLTWTAPEYMHTHKTADWYWIVGIVALTLAVISTLFGDMLFGIFIVVGAFTLALYASLPPQFQQIKISEKGVQIQDTFYSYNVLESFWIEEKELHPRILFKSERHIAPYIIVLLGEVPAEEIRDVLSQHLHEVKHSEPFLEKLLIWLGF